MKGYFRCLRGRTTRAKLIALTILLIFLSAAGSSTAAQLRVTTTFSVLADLAEQVGGNRVDVNSIVPLGGDPHTWEPTPREARNVAAADVLFYNGLGLELWVDRLISNAARPDLPIVTLSDGLEPRPGPSFAAHVHDEGDPHFWLNVEYGMHYVRRILDTFIELDPEGEAYYRARAEDYLDTLAELDAWLFDIIEEIPEEHRFLVTYHDAFGYLADRYGLEITGFLVVNPDREPSSREMAELVTRLGKLPRPVVFIEPQVSSGQRYAEAIAGEIGGSVAILYSDSLTTDVATYVDMMRFNGQQLWEALR